MKLQQCMGVEYLRECFDADFKAGVLVWRSRPQKHFRDARTCASWNARYAGAVAGGPHKEGYVAVTVSLEGMRTVLLAHRILWCMKTGEWPKETIDHRDMDRTNNKFCNLREATYGEQNANRPAIRAGLKGASLDKRTGRYVAQITSDGTYRFLGRFDSEAEAHRAYVEAAERLHGDFARAS